ncbi:MAG: phosphoribosylglycinamide formyltransferase [Thermoplasmata archaeon]|jgi:formyltetrahydrofolate-dependent phosphoribosylglycinamide formyltransferase
MSIGVLASGEGTTFEGIARGLQDQQIPARINLVVSDRVDAHVLERARRWGFPILVLPRRGGDRDLWAEELSRQLHQSRVELVVLAGFLAILPARWVEEWRGRAINLHPSLLPRFGGRGMHGMRVHTAVLAAGERETGATVHIVTNDVDGGPILGQERMGVSSDDTPESLRERLHPLEVRLMIETIRRFAEGDLALPYPVAASAGTGPRTSESAVG